VAGFGGLMPNREVDSELIARWRADLSASPPKRWWVALRDDSIVGFVGIAPSRDPIDPTLGELDTIAVEPSHWRTGVGTVLMSHALHHLSADGYREARGRSRAAILGRRSQGR
jgi:N-acetylglutamate synthase-like GNAT family acetyltransferase